MLTEPSPQPLVLCELVASVLLDPWGGWRHPGRWDNSLFISFFTSQGRKKLPASSGLWDIEGTKTDRKPCPGGCGVLEGETDIAAVRGRKKSGQDPGWES